MPGRVEENPEGRPGLVLVLGRAELEHRGLAGVEVVDDHVEMHLLWYLLGRPVRRGVVLHLLERDALTFFSPDIGPAGGELCLPVKHRAVESGESVRFGAVDDEAWVACDSHAGTVPVVPDDQLPVTPGL
jgi:hypothetical protein